MPKTTELIVDGDTQLWVFRSGDWEIPIFCAPGHIAGTQAPLFAVWPCLVMDEEPTNALAESMSLRMIEAAAGYYILKAEKLSEVASPVYGITPATHFKHKGVAAKLPQNRSFQTGEKTQPKPSQLAKFIAKRSGTIGEDIVTAVLGSLAALAPEILLRERMPIDLGFCRIHALPYRVGWQAMFSNEHRKPPEKNEDAQLWRDESGFDTVTLLRAQNIEGCATKGEGSAIVRWNLEIESTDAFRESADAIERKVLEHAGATAYVRRWCDIVYELRDSIYSLWRTWLDKATAPTCSVFEVGRLGAQRFSAHRRNLRVVPDRVSNTVRRLACAPANPEHSPSVGALLKAPDEVSSLPAVQPQADELRNSGGNP